MTSELAMLYARALGRLVSQLVSAGDTEALARLTVQLQTLTEQAEAGWLVSNA